LWHQLLDVENDRVAGVRTFAVRHSRSTVHLAGRVVLPVEAVALAVMLWRVPSIWPIVGLVVYAAFATLIWRVWKVVLVAVEPGERCAIAAREYYTLLLPVAALIASTLRHPIDATVLVAHLLAFRAPAMSFARQVRVSLRVLAQSIR
jgi:hypothetical protein